MLAAVPEFLLATVALLVCGVWLGLLPTAGWAGPEYLVLPAIALGVPAAVCWAAWSRTRCRPCSTNAGWSCGAARA